MNNAKDTNYLQKNLQTADVANDYWVNEKVILIVGLDENQ